MNEIQESLSEHNPPPFYCEDGWTLGRAAQGGCGAPSLEMLDPPDTSLSDLRGAGWDRDPPAPASPALASSPRARQGKSCPRKLALLIKRIIQSATQRSIAPCLAAAAPRGLQVCIKSTRRDVAPSPQEQPPSAEAAIRSPAPAIRAGLGARVNQNLSVIIAEPV